MHLFDNLVAFMLLFVKPFKQILRTKYEMRLVVHSIF